MLSHDIPDGRSVAFHALAPEEAIAILGTRADTGITQQEAARRLKQYGPNALQTARRMSWYILLFRQFIDVLIFILLIAAAVSFAIGKIGDTLTILAIVILNGVLGFVQEWKAEKALAALQRMLAPRCKVVRDGREQNIDVRTLVPGDIVLLETGDRVPADLRLVEAINLKIDESALTGESVSVAKSVEPAVAAAPLAERRCMVWMGTAVANGLARGVVVATGMQTEFGRIAHLTQTVGNETTLLQRKLAVLGRQLGIYSVAISIVVAVAGWLMGKPLVEMFLTGVSLAVAVVPEGLPAVVTITLALGVRAMVRRRALLRRLQAAETLGAATIICTDKTGTLTKNEMTVRHIWLPAGEVAVTGVGYDPAGRFEVNGRKLDYHQRPDLLALLQTGLLCSHARREKDETGGHQIGEPTEAALVTAAYKAWLSPPAEPSIVNEFSFNSGRKRMTVVEQTRTGRLAHVKGAPEVILERCTRILDGATERVLSDADRTAIVQACTRLAESGLRTLALARRQLAEDIPLYADVVEAELTFLGVVGIIDPPRPEVPEAIRTARQAGIRTIMITGDATATALAVARRIGLEAEQALTGQDLRRMDDDALRAVLRDRPVLFARTTPENKLRIVTLLQSLEHVVGMTGDGVNDAPALKKADIGIAMGQRGTDVARGAADMILTDDNFASIIGAVEEGRRQYDNIQKFVRYLLSSNTGEVLAILVNILVGGPLILLPVQILWMNLVTDGMTAVALGVEPAEKDIMRCPPRAAHEPILDHGGILMIALLGGYIGLATLWLFHHYIQDGTEAEILLAQTVAFTGIIVLEKMNVFNYRALREPLSVAGFLSNPWVLLAWAVTIGLQICAVYVPVLQGVLHTTPLGWADWGLIFAVALPVLLVSELWKLLHGTRKST